MYLSAPDEVEKFAPLFERIEALVGLRGRRFYGAFFDGANEYHACVKLEAGDSPRELGLETETLPGGRFLRHRLRGDAPAVYELIAPTFKKLQELAEMDTTRPGIEFYRANGQIDCLLPVRAMSQVHGGPTASPKRCMR